MHPTRVLQRVERDGDSLALTIKLSDGSEATVTATDAHLQVRRPNLKECGVGTGPWAADSGRNSAHSKSLAYPAEREG